jgi:hypothetical protein
MTIESPLQLHPSLMDSDTAGITYSLWGQLFISEGISLR